MGVSAFDWVLLAVFLTIWLVILRVWWQGLTAEYVDELWPPAVIAAVASFLFMGPFCIAIWVSLGFRFICLDQMGKHHRQGDK